MNAFKKPGPGRGFRPDAEILNAFKKAVVSLPSQPCGSTRLDAPQAKLFGIASYGAHRLHSLALPLQPPLPPGLVVGLQTGEERRLEVVLRRRVGR